MTGPELCLLRVVRIFTHRSGQRVCQSGSEVGRACGAAWDGAAFTALSDVWRQEPVHGSWMTEVKLKAAWIHLQEIYVGG